ncbi:7608_t:CDS:10 [Paraglomus brasilianum]|uniref:Conserved oligomeric Golgi complex subunit 3 n=1 Tax=Paraglomus brasilianum TaxID=144538 RepID=A0A9N8ZZT2_9GLOM|nr:7608_t:CDS:10 [Paraglomus brasilianum]
MATSLTTRGKGITLEDWESKTQLTETQKVSVLELQDACKELPLPEGSSELAAGGASIDAALGLGKPIETTQQFFDWFAKMEADMEKDQEDVYRNFLAAVMLYREANDKVLGQIDTTESLFNDLEGNFKFVEDRTKALQTSCEKLLAEQNHLSSIVESIVEKLRYYDELEDITKLFNSPGENICEQPEFVPKLKRLDECLEYMQNNLRYRDSELYLMRFRQCMTRGMTLIKMYFVNEINTLSMEIAKQTAQNASSANQTALHYVKFRTIAPKLKGLVREIEKRCPGHREYYSLLNDCYKAYFVVRQQVLIPAIVAQIQEISASGQDILTFARTGYAYMLDLCSDEYSLFYNFFSTGEDHLYGNLDLLCSYLYDDLRPRIIHETDIDTLSELCNILQIHADQDAERGSEGQRLQFGHLVKNVLQDTQQRLVFRAQAYIQSSIQKFIPQEEDLNYPARLKNNSTEAKVESTSDTHSPTSPSTGPATLSVHEYDDNEPPTPGAMLATVNTGDIYRGWYPPLQRTLWILSKLYRSVNTTIFNDIAQDVVSTCLQSLLSVSESLEKQSRIDRQLFLIKHLLILKEHISSFETQFVHEEKGLDFSQMTDALNAIMRNKYSILSPNTLFGLAQKGIPKVVENRTDSKQEVDQGLKHVCEEFIMESAKAAVEPLSSFLVKVSAFRLRNDLKPLHQQTRLKSQNFAQPVNIVEVYETFRQSVTSRLRFIVSKMSDYIDDLNTEQFLLSLMQNHIIDSYQEFYDIIQQEIDFTTLTRAPGTVEEIIDWVKERVLFEDEVNEGGETSGVKVWTTAVE